MANEAAKARLRDLMEAVQDGMRSVARMQRDHAKHTASASAADKRVTVVVNADCVVIETVFGAGVEDLSHREIADAFTAAAQEAAAKMRRMTAEMVESVRQDNARLPRLSDFLPGMPDVQDMLPAPPAASTAPPAARGAVVIADDAAPALRFADVEAWDHARGDDGRTDVTESGW